MAMQPIFLKYQLLYSGYNWLFVDEIKLLIDDQVYNLDFEKDKQRITNNGSVKEYNTFYATSDFIFILEKLINSKNKVLIRFSGTEGYKDEKFNKYELEGIKLTLDYFNSL